MMTSDEILAAIWKLPAPERQRLVEQIARSEVQELTDEEYRHAMMDLRKLWGSVNTGKVLVPFPDREQLYDENW